jgi:hypothetical protein
MAKKKSNSQRIREMLEKGKSAHYISNTLKVTLQHVYNVRWHMKNAAKKASVGEATIIIPTPRQLELDFNKKPKPPESIQGEYGKYQQMSVWQRIKFNFKSAIGF